MIDTVINNIKNSLINNNCKAVYSAFDAVPYYSKNNEISTYIGMQEFETHIPIYSLNTVFIPFSAVAEISVHAPAEFSADKLFAFFSNYILSALNNSDYHIYEFKKITVKPDTNLKKLILKCDFCLSGIFRKENSSL